jgi:PhzF family phenazine biosynthesis protein
MRRFAQVDVFTAQPGRDDATMARVANWTNLSETTFVLPPTTPEADYRVRIFTPSRELKMAGHPTLGTCRALIGAGVLAANPQSGAWTQECLAGLVSIRPSEDGVLSFAVPPSTVTPSPVSDQALSRVLGGVLPTRPLLVDLGLTWLTGEVTLAQLDRLDVDAGAFRIEIPEHLGGVTVFAIDDKDTVHVRSFFEADGAVIEDPVCGSGNAAVGLHLRHTGRAADLPSVYQARQGSHRGRDGRITVTIAEQVWVGGQAIPVITGEIVL